VYAAERRRRERTRLHWAIHLTGPEFVEGGVTRTEDLSSNGFSCLVPHPVQPGAMRICTVRVLTYLPHRGETDFGLECLVRVVWVKRTGENEYMMGCEIADYRTRRDGDAAAEMAWRQR
jgi:hypothetical protein